MKAKTSLDERTEEQRLRNPQQYADCVQSKLVLRGLLGVSYGQNIDQDCLKRLNQSQETASLELKK